MLNSLLHDSLRMTCRGGYHCCSENLNRLCEEGKSEDHHHQMSHTEDFLVKGMEIATRTVIVREAWSVEVTIAIRRCFYEYFMIFSLF